MTEQIKSNDIGTLTAAVEAALLSVTWPDGGHEGLPTRRTAQMLAPAILDLIAAREASARAEGARSALLEAADDLDQQRSDFAAEDEAEGCTSRFCGGWFNGVLFSVQRLHARAGS